MNDAANQLSLAELHLSEPTQLSIRAMDSTSSHGHEDLGDGTAFWQRYRQNGRSFGAGHAWSLQAKHKKSSKDILGASITILPHQPAVCIR